MRARPILRLALVALAAAWAGPGSAAQEAPPSPPANDLTAFFDRMEAAWQTRNLEAWTALREFATPADREAESSELGAYFASDDVVFTLLRRPKLRPDQSELSLEAQIFVVNEPRARVVFWTLHVARRPTGFAIVSVERTSQMEGLMHLSLGPRAFRAKGVSLRQHDFELRLEDGTLFTSPDEVGPTLIVFVGKARVRFTPGPAAEREQLRQFSGKPTLERQVDWAFVRMPPADFLVDVGRQPLEPEIASSRRRQKAEQIFRERSGRSFLVDAPLPRSPWWLMPGPGDAVIDFPWPHKKVLTFARTASEPEDVNLFDRDRRLQICSYASSGGPLVYNEDEDRALDVLDHEITARLEPASLELRVTHRMRVRLLNPVSSVRLRLDDDFRVASVQSGDGGSLLYFRVRDQGTIVVSLGPLANRTEPFELVTRYAGRHDPAAVDQELLQISAPIRDTSDELYLEHPPTVYANRTAWYPHPPNEDYATAHVVFDTPEGWLAVTGGTEVGVQTVANRTRSEFRLREPGKFLTAVVGRLSDVGVRQQGDQTVRGYATPRTRRETLDAMQDVEQMLAFYASKFGPSPYPTLGLVVAAGETPGGHSPPGLIYMQERPPILHGRPLPEDPSNFSDLPGYFLAHEAAHQWWGQGTAPANYHERWLSEAWAQYAAALWVRERLGEKSFFSMMDRMGGWAMRDDSAGPIHLGQRLGHLKQEPRYFRAVVYDKGAWVLHMLRGLVGDEAFFTGARAFLQQHRYAKATTEDLRSALERASGKDLKAYFDRWVYETGLPGVTWSPTTARTGTGFRTTIDLRPVNFPGPLPLSISLYTGAGAEARTVELGPEGGSFTFDTPDEPGRISLNEDRGLLVQIERGRPTRQR
jgi:hypothetical protein